MLIHCKKLENESNLNDNYKISSYKSAKCDLQMNVSYFWRTSKSGVREIWMSTTVDKREFLGSL